MEQNDKELKPASDKRDRDDIKANSIKLKGILKVQGEPRRFTRSMRPTKGYAPVSDKNLKETAAKG